MMRQSEVNDIDILTALGFCLRILEYMNCNTSTVKLTTKMNTKWIMGR
jgi:hypothetical protein